MRLARFIRHLAASRAGTRRRFPAEALARIESAIEAAERRSSGEIRVAIESALEPLEAWSDLPPRERALQVFSDLHLWDTELRNGVLIYVLMADRDVEIVADQGAARVIPREDWEGICRLMEERFRAGEFPAGAVAGVEAVGRLLERHFPGNRLDELPNQPVLL